MTGGFGMIRVWYIYLSDLPSQSRQIHVQAEYTHSHWSVMGAIQRHQVDCFLRQMFQDFLITKTPGTSRDPIQHRSLPWINMTFLGPYVFKCFLAIISWKFNIIHTIFFVKNASSKFTYGVLQNHVFRAALFFGSALSDGVRQNTLEPFSPSLISPRLAEGSSEGKESWWSSVVTLHRGSG